MVVKKLDNFDSQLNLVCFFNSVAHCMGFHPLLEPSGWYDVTKQNILAHEVVYSVYVYLLWVKNSYCCDTREGEV